jgi:CBS domain-containing protein
MKTAAQVMTDKVVQVTPDTSIECATRLMLDHGVSGLPVADASGALVGMLTEGDLLRRVEIGTIAGHSRWQELFGSLGKAARDYVHTHSRRVSDIMTPQVLSVAPDTPLAHVVELMEKHHIKRVPVVSEGRMLGIVSRANLVAALVDQITPAQSSDRPPVRSAAESDTALRKSILSAIRAEYWAPTGTLELVVKDGCVELAGIIFNPDERRALRVAVENVPGVKSVVDHLSWIEPMTGTVVATGGEQ